MSSVYDKEDIGVEIVNESLHSSLVAGSPSRPTSHNFSLASEVVPFERSECSPSQQLPLDSEIRRLGEAVERSKKHRSKASSRKQNRKKSFLIPPYKHLLWCCCPLQILCLPVLFCGLCMGCAWGEDDLGILIPCETIWLDNLGYYEGTASPCERCCVCCCIDPLIGCNKFCGMYRDEDAESI